MDFAKHAGIALRFHQSNHEGALVDLIQEARQTADALIINPAGYSFTSVALLDALRTFSGPIIEVHISNIHARTNCIAIPFYPQLLEASYAAWVPTGTWSRYNRRRTCLAR